MNKQFLIVEDDRQILSFIQFALKTQNYHCFEASTGAEALNYLDNEQISAVILDLGLPDMDGIDIIKIIREKSLIPIIVVSARDQDHDKVEALDSGADDYLTKPFSIDELLARIRVVFRHQSLITNGTETIFKIGDLEIHYDKHRVILEGNEIHLTPIEYEVLELMSRNAGKVLTHNYLLKEIWGTHLDSDTQTLRVFMANIRRKIEKSPAKPRYILTEVGIGYRLAED